MARAGRPALRVVLRSAWHRHCDLGQRVFPGVWVAWRAAAVILEGPAQDAFPAEIGVLEMVNPGEEGRMTLDDRAEAFVGVGLVARDARPKLRDEPGVIELLFLAGAQVGLGTGQPKDIALEEQLPVTKGPAVVSEQSLLRKREQPVEAAVDEPVCGPGLLVQKMRQRPVRGDVFAPHHRIAQDQDFVRCGRLAKPPAIEPVVLAQRVRDAVVRPGLKPLDPLPKPGRQNHNQSYNSKNRQPLRGAETDFVDPERHGGLGLCGRGRPRGTPVPPGGGEAGGLGAGD